jgi:integrase
MCYLEIGRNQLMNRVKLTKRVVESVKPGKADLVFWDRQISGFGCKVTPRGKRTYLFYYRTLDGQQRRPALGVHGRITCDLARTKAQQWLARVALGEDPSEDLREARAKPTVREFSERYLDEHARPKKKPSSVKSDISNLNNHVLPALGKKRLDLVTRIDIQRLHAKMVGRPGAANHVMGLLGKMFNLAEKWGLRPDGTNPCRHIEKYPGRKMERYLSTEEFGRLARILNQAEMDGSIFIGAIRAIRLLIFTGCRLGEILSLKWDYIDFENKRINLPDSKTGRKTIYLSGPAIEVLNSVPRVPDNPHVLVGRFDRGHMTRMGHQWEQIRKRADLNDVRMHDLRHSYASVAANLGESLPMIGKLLGHTQAQTTTRYAHLAADPVKEAAERIATRIDSAMKGKKAA